MLVITIITLFFCVSIAPCISAFIYNNIDEKKSINEQINDIVSNPLDSLLNDDTASLTFYTFDKTGRKQNKIDIPSYSAIEIKNVFDELNYKIVYESKRIETQELKNEFINLLDENGLLSEKQSKDEVLLLLNPGWLKSANDSNNLKARNPFSNVLIRPFFVSYFGTSVFCSVSSAGAGMMMPLFMLPRPRAVAMWFSSSDYGVTSVANLFTGRGFLAGGAQGGLLLGFMGIGLTYAIPGYTVYGFIGYSLFAGVTAQYMEFLPPNNAPVISNENPVNNAVNVPIDLDELSFRIEDPDKDLMSYTVTTDPDIGSGQGQAKTNGVYSVPVSGLEQDKKYSWTVEVSDGNILVEKKFGFITMGRPPFDPFDEGWQYRKKITINHTQIVGNLVDFPVLVNVVDVNLRDKAQADGDDILFMDGSGVAEKLYHEIEFFSGSSGELVAWVKIPSLISNQDTEFYLYYGNPGCSSQQFPEKVWDSHYMMVQHMMDGSTNTITKDSTNNYHGTKGGTGPIQTIVDAKIGYAEDFTGDEWIDVTIDNGQTYSIEFWDYPREIGTNGQIYNGQGTNPTYIYAPNIAYWNGANPPNLQQYAAAANRDGSWFYTGQHSAPENQWHHIVFTVAGTSANLYLDGLLKVSQIEQYNPTTTGSHYIGYRADKEVHHNGVIDEFRCSNIARSPEWISTEYNNQNDPFSFLSFGLEESAP